MNKVATVKKRGDFHARRKNLVIQLPDLLVDGDERFVGVRALAKENDAFHNVLVIQDGAVGAVDGPADLAEAYSWCLCDARNIFHANRRAILRFDNRARDVVHIREQTDSANVDLLKTCLDEAAARVHIVICELLLNLTDTQSVGD